MTRAVAVLLAVVAMIIVLRNRLRAAMLAPTRYEFSAVAPQCDVMIMLVV